MYCHSCLEFQRLVLLAVSATISSIFNKVDFTVDFNGSNLTGNEFECSRPSYVVTRLWGECGHTAQ